MVNKFYKELAKGFLEGNLSLETLTKAIEDRLFELRQIPEVTEEQHILSKIELILHEASEEYRPISDLYKYLESLTSSASIANLP